MRWGDIVLDRKIVLEIKILSAGDREMECLR